MQPNEVDDSQILNSSLLRIFTSNDHNMFDQTIGQLDDETLLLIKKLTVVLLGKKRGLLSDKALNVVADKELFKSFLEGNIDIDRLKTLLKLEMDMRVAKDFKTRLRYNHVTIDEMMNENATLSSHNVYTKVVGFDFVREFSYSHRQMKVWIHGGAAEYLHILNQTDKKIDFDDIDFSIEDFDVSDEDIYNELLRFTDSFCSQRDLSHKDDFKKRRISIIDEDGSLLVNLIYYINNDDFTDIETIHDIPVISFDRVIDKLEEYMGKFEDVEDLDAEYEVEKMKGSYDKRKHAFEVLTGTPRKEDDNIGFTFVREFIEEHKEMKVWINGGAAEYLHVLDKYNKKIELNDVDFNIISTQPEKVVYEELIDFTNRFCKKRGLESKIKLQPTFMDEPFMGDASMEDFKYGIGYIYLIDSEGNQLTELNFFINQNNETKTVKMNGLNVISLHEVQKQLDDFFADYEYITANSNDEDDLKMFKSKYERKKPAYDYLM